MKIEFKDVSFAYNESDGEVLHDVNLQVESGKTCAFVGPSGGGKSTIFNLLMRFYDVGRGQVLINGRDVRDYKIESLRKNIAEVSQDVFLFNGTITENIRFGAPDATDEQIKDAAKISNAYDFIMKLPNGFDTQVGERGTLLSGGQKQRVAIARALLRDAPILLLDEATSALDTESEKLIQASLEKLMKGRTVFVIAHRLSTIIDADNINVILGGRIVESGTDAELVALGGEYKKLRDIQFKQ
jgi:ABC-type multidrug transport system fused ATPase/permease subunit